MNLPFIKLFADSGETIEMLSDAEAGRLLKSLLRYVNDQEPILSGNEKFVFAMLKAQMDRDAAGYQAFLDKQRANGMKGGRPRKNPENPRVIEQNPENPRVISETQKTLYHESDNDVPIDDIDDSYKDDDDEALRERAREEIRAAWKENFGKQPTPAIVEGLSLRVLMLEFQDGVIRKAIEKTALKNTNSPFDYICSMILDWNHNGVKTTEDVDKYAYLWDKSNSDITDGAFTQMREFRERRVGNS